MQAVNNALSDGRQFLCGDRFTIADICIGYSLALGKSPHYGLDYIAKYPPAVRDYIQNLEARTDYQVCTRKTFNILTHWRVACLCQLV